MAVPYVVRKKADLTSGERKELWYGVPKKTDKIRFGIENLPSTWKNGVDFIAGR